jgi:hypothetical protein
MRTLALVLMLTLATPVTLVVSEDGRQRQIRLPGGGPDCPSPVDAQVIVGTPARAEVFIEGRSEGNRDVYLSRDEVFVSGARGWCRFPIGAGAASTRGPWLAFIAMFGGLTIAIGLVALWGLGRGPEPKLEPVADENH